VAGKRLLEIGRGCRTYARWSWRSRGGETIIPSGRDTRIEEGDQVFIMGEPKHMPDVLPLAGYDALRPAPRHHRRRQPRGWFLAHMLEEHKIGCTI
jgi:hypothetical protein